MKTYYQDEFMTKQHICEKCGGYEDVGLFSTNNPLHPLHYTVCVLCMADKEAFTEWLKDQIEAALNDSDDWEKLPNGEWTKKG